MENKEPNKKCQSSFIDHFVEMLPEIHIMGYSYCGPNTDLKKRLARGELGINDLDHACKEHDIAYVQSGDIKIRNRADKILVSKSFKRAYAKNSRISERFSALIVSGLISIKIFLNKIQLYISHNFSKFSSFKKN